MKSTATAVVIVLLSPVFAATHEAGAEPARMSQSLAESSPETDRGNRDEQLVAEVHAASLARREQLLRDTVATPSVWPHGRRAVTQ